MAEESICEFSVTHRGAYTWIRKGQKLEWVSGINHTEENTLTNNVRSVCQLESMTTVRMHKLVFIQWLSAWTYRDDQEQDALL